MGDRQKVFDDGGGMIRQGDRAQTNYRRSETLPEKMLKDKIDVTAFMVDFIEKYHINHSRLDYGD